MSRTKVTEHTRTLANGTQVQVHQHARAYNPAADETDRRTPVDRHRKERLKREAALRREAALQRGGAATKRGAIATKKRAKQTWHLMQAGGRRLKKAGQYAGRRRRAMAAACVVGGVAEVGAGLMWSTAGLVWTAVSIIGATLIGGLFLGGSKTSGKGTA